MKQKISILLLLCVAILLPSIATAQEFNIFAKQKVVIADIIDVNDRQLSDGIKTVIRKGIMDACVNSEDYEVPEVNLNDVKQQVKAKGLPVTPLNICKAIGAKADYIIFTNVKLSSSEVGAQNITIYISSSLYRIATGSEMKTGVAEAAPTSSSILSTTSNLVSELLGLNSSTRGSASAQSSNTQSHSYSQTAQLAEKTYKVGDYYDANGKQGVVFVVTPDGKHGKMIIAGIHRQKVFHILLRFVLNLSFVFTHFADIHPFHLTRQ